MIARRTIFSTLLLGLVLVAQSGAATSPPPFKGTARMLLPLGAVAHQPIANGLKANLTSPSGTVTVQVYPTMAAALSSYRGRCSGCESMIYPQGWRYKRSFTPTEDAKIRRTNPQTLAITAICSNVIVGVQITAPATKTTLTTQAGFIANDIYKRAHLSPCRAEQPVPTKKVYWTQSHAEERVVAVVKIPYCTVYPNDGGCARLPGMHPRTAQCVGVDELGSTFTYSRFTCKIVVTDYYGKPLAQGNIAVYPTGSTSFVWKLI